MENFNTGIFLSKRICMSTPLRQLFECHKKWEEMIPTENGRFCATCEKEVIDFTNKSDRFVQEFLERSNGTFCARMKKSFLLKRSVTPALKKFLSVFVAVFGLAFFTHTNAFSQDVHKGKPPLDQHVFGGFVCEPVFSYGGQKGLISFIQKHVRYPRGETKTGTVIVVFFIYKNGSIGNPKIMRSLGEKFDAEALRVTKLLRFEPFSGDPSLIPKVVQYSIPIRFATR